MYHSPHELGLKEIVGLLQLSKLKVKSGEDFGALQPFTFQTRKDF